MKKWFKIDAKHGKELYSAENVLYITKTTA